jgi:hypothetical protein
MIAVTGKIEDQNARRHEQKKPHGLRDAADGVTRHPLEDAPGLLDCAGNHGETGRGQHKIARGARGVGRAADGDAHVGLFQRRRVVDPVAGHADDVAGTLKDLDDPELVLGENAREAVGGDDPRRVRVRLPVGEDLLRDHDLAAEPELARNLRGNRLMVAGHHLNVDPHRASRRNRLGAVVARRVEERQEAKEAPSSGCIGASDAERAIAFARVMLDQGVNRLSLRRVRLAEVENHLRCALGDSEALVVRLHVRLGPFRDRIERPKRTHGVGIELQCRRFAGASQAVAGRVRPEA